MIFGHVRDLESGYAWLARAAALRARIPQADGFRRLAAGQYELRGRDIYAKVTDLSSKPHAEARAEVHRRYIDVHYFFTGIEQICCACDSGDNVVAEDLLAERDVRVYAGVDNESTLTMTPGSFAIFFPGDVHRPGGADCAPRPMRKVVVKVRAALLDKGRPMKTIRWGMIGLRLGCRSEERAGILHGAALDARRRDQPASRGGALLRGAPWRRQGL